MIGRRRLVVRSALVVVAVVSAATAASTIGVPGGPAPAQTPVVQIRSAHGASFLPALQGKRPLFILAIGSDARPNQIPTSTRSDSIHLIGMDVRRHRASILGFPRDSYVPIPGHGTDKINSALFFGGPTLLVQTVESLTGIRIDFWVLTGFKGFVRFWNDVGPVDVNVPRPMSDPYSGANFTTGVHALSGSQALSFARDRHDVPGGDIGRSENQGLLLIAAMAKLAKKVKSNPAVLFFWMAAGWRSASTDIAPSQLIDVALTALQIPKKSVKNLVVPATTGSAGAASVVFISPSAQSIYADMRTDGAIG